MIFNSIATGWWMFALFSWLMVKVPASSGIRNGQPRTGYWVRYVDSRRNFILGLTCLTLSVSATHAAEQQTKSMAHTDVPPSEMPPKPILNAESGAINFSASLSSDTLFSLGLKDALTASARLELVEPDGTIESVPACTLTQSWSITKSDPAKGEIALSWAATPSSAAERIE